MKKNLNTKLFTMLIAGGALAIGGCSPQDQPQDTAKGFMEDWISYQGSPLEDEFYNNHPALTEDFIAKIDQTLASFDKSAYDPVLCAQDKPTEIRIANTAVKEDDAVITLEEIFSGGNRMIEAKMVEKNGEWRIDDIICNEGERIDQHLNSQVSPAIQNRVGDTIRENIAELSPKDPILGGQFYVTEIHFTGPKTAEVDYEDGHIALRAIAEFEVPNAETVNITSFELTEKNASN